jgi:hydrogenase expression/formation protein HypD
LKYIDEFRGEAPARGLAAAIAREADPAREYRIMEFCGGHTHAISRYGIADLLPASVRLIHGPGCPVCVLPMGRIDSALELALDHGVMLLAYGDCMRVPASNGLSLIKARARGADVRMVYSTQDALRFARDNPGREVVFFAIGFETTTPATAIAVLQAEREGLANFSVFCNHVLTPPAIEHIVGSVAQAPEVAIDGFIGPAHVSTVIGSRPYERFAREHGKPVVIAGFEPLDVMLAIRMLVAQLNQGRAEIENEFTRAVTPEGNLKAQRLVAQVFELRDRFEWRGLGVLPASSLQLNQRYRGFDAEAHFGLVPRAAPDNKACECGAILRGRKRPSECGLFATVCTPENPMGSCMVSSEGACAAHYTYGRFRDAA